MVTKARKQDGDWEEALMELADSFTTSSLWHFVYAPTNKSFGICIKSIKSDVSITIRVSFRVKNEWCPFLENIMLFHIFSPLEKYNSLLDTNLAGYFSNPRKLRHLQDIGLVILYKTPCTPSPMIYAYISHGKCHIFPRQCMDIVPFLTHPSLQLYINRVWIQFSLCVDRKINVRYRSLLTVSHEWLEVVTCYCSLKRSSSSRLFW